MKNDEPSPGAVRTGRRRTLGAIAMATWPAVVPAAALAAGDAPLRRDGARHDPRHDSHAAGQLRYREGWLLAQSDR